MNQFSGLNPSGTHATSENAGSRNEYFGKSTSTQYSEHFVVNERPAILSSWNVGDDAGIYLQRIRVDENGGVVSAEDVTLNERNMVLSGVNNVMFVCHPGTYRLRVQDVDPSEVVVQKTSSQLPHQNYVPAMLAATSGAMSIQDLLDLIEANEDKIIASGTLSVPNRWLQFTRNDGTTMEVMLLSSDNDNIIGAGNDGLLYAPPHAWMAASIAP